MSLLPPSYTQHWRDDTLAKCFHASCSRFLTVHGAGAPDAIALSSVLAEIYYDFHQELLHLKDVAYTDNAYRYLVSDRKIHPRVVEDAMLRPFLVSTISTPSLRLN